MIGWPETSPGRPETSSQKGDATTPAWCDGAFGRPLRPAGVAGRGTEEEL
jgi:hypothetical protein